MSKNDKVHKLVKKETIGYQYTTDDHSIFTYDLKTNDLTIENVFVNNIEMRVRLTQHTLKMLTKLLKCIQEEKDESIKLD